MKPTPRKLAVLISLLGLGLPWSAPSMAASGSAGGAVRASSTDAAIRSALVLLQGPKTHAAIVDWALFYTPRGANTPHGTIAFQATGNELAPVAHKFGRSAVAPPLQGDVSAAGSGVQAKRRPAIRALGQHPLRARSRVARVRKSSNLSAQKLKPGVVVAIAVPSLARGVVELLDVRPLAADLLPGTQATLAAAEQATATFLTNDFPVASSDGQVAADTKQPSARIDEQRLSDDIQAGLSLAPQHEWEATPSWTSAMKAANKEIEAAIAVVEEAMLRGGERGSTKRVQVPETVTELRGLSQVVRVRKSLNVSTQGFKPGFVVAKEVPPLVREVVEPLDVQPLAVDLSPGTLATRAAAKLVTPTFLPENFPVVWPESASHSDEPSTRIDEQRFPDDYQVGLPLGAQLEWEATPGWTSAMRAANKEIEAAIAVVEEAMLRGSEGGLKKRTQVLEAATDVNNAGNPVIRNAASEKVPDTAKIINVHTSALSDDSIAIDQGSRARSPRPVAGQRLQSDEELEALHYALLDLLMSESATTTSSQHSDNSNTRGLDRLDYALRDLMCASTNSRTFCERPTIPSRVGRAAVIPPRDVELASLGGTIGKFAEGIDAVLDLSAAVGRSATSMPIDKMPDAADPAHLVPMHDQQIGESRKVLDTLGLPSNEVAQAPAHPSKLLPPAYYFVDELETERIIDSVVAGELDLDLSGLPATPAIVSGAGYESAFASDRSGAHQPNVTQLPAADANPRPDLFDLLDAFEKENIRACVLAGFFDLGSSSVASVSPQPRHRAALATMKSFAAAPEETTILAAVSDPGPSGVEDFWGEEDEAYLPIRNDRAFEDHLAFDDSDPPRETGSVVPLGRMVAIDDAALDQMRGGFETDAGLKVSFGIERAVYINGNLVTTTSLNVADLSKMSAGQAQLEGLNQATMTLVQNGPGNTFLSGQLSSNNVGTVIQNTLNDQNIQGVTLINATVNSLEIVKAAAVQSSIRTAIADSLRR